MSAFQPGINLSSAPYCSMGYYTAPLSMFTPSHMDPCAIDFSEDPAFKKIKNSEMLLEAKPSKFEYPTIIVNLGQLATHLSQALRFGDQDSQVYLIKDSAAQVIGGPISNTWHLFIGLNLPLDGQGWKNYYKKMILKVTKEYIAERIQESALPSKEAPPIAPALMSEVYDLTWDRTWDRTSFVFCYKLGPRINLEFSSNSFFPMNASSLGGWRIFLPKEEGLYKALGQCIVGDRILPSQELIDAQIDVRQRHFFAANVPGLFSSMLHSLGNGASINCKDHGFMQDQLASICPAELKKMWEKFQQPHLSCLRTQLIHFINFLGLVEESATLSKIVAQLGIDGFNHPGILAFAQYLEQNPALTPDILSVLYGLCLHQLTLPDQNKILHAFGMPFDHPQKPRPYVALPSNLGIRYLEIAAPNQDGSPEDIALRFFKCNRMLSNRTLFEPLLDVLGLDPLGNDQDGKAIMNALLSSWQGPCLKTLLAIHYPYKNRSIPRSLINVYDQMVPKEPTLERILEVSQKNAIIPPKISTPQYETLEGPKIDSPLSSNVSTVEKILPEEELEIQGQFISLLNALSKGHVTTFSDWIKARLQLLDMTPETLRESWIEFQPSHGSLSRTQLVHILNLLFLVQQNQPLCQKIAQLLLDIQPENLKVGNDFAQVLLKHPEMAPVFRDWFLGVCLYTWGTQATQASLSQDLPENPCPYAQFACENEILQLVLAFPGEIGTPEDIALKFFKSMETLSQKQAELGISLSVMKPILAILDLIPLADEGSKDMRQVMEDVVHAWQQPRIKGLLQKYFPTSRPIYRPLTNRLKKQKQILAKTQKLAFAIQCKFAITPTRNPIPYKRQIRHQLLGFRQNREWMDNEEKKQPPSSVMITISQNQMNQCLLRHWKELVTEAQGDHADYEQIAAKMIDEWSVIKEIFPAGHDDFIHVLLRSKNLEHLKRALSLAAKAKQSMSINLASQQHILKAIGLITLEEWSDDLTENVGDFLKSLCQDTPIPDEIIQNVLPAFQTCPKKNLHHLIPPLLENSQSALSSSLFIEKFLPIIQDLTFSAIHDRLWIASTQYHRWTKKHLSDENYKMYASKITSQLKNDLQLSKIMKENADSEDIINTLTLAPMMLSLYHAIDPIEAGKTIKLVFKNTLNPENVTYSNQLILLFQACEDLQLFPKDDSETRRDILVGLIITICKFSFDENGCYVLNWIVELNTHINYNNEKQITGLSFSNFLYMHCLLRQVFLSEPTQINQAVSNLKTHFEGHWLPLKKKMQEEK